MAVEAPELQVLHIVRQFSPSVGGLEDSVLSIARAQRAQGDIDARVLTLDRVFGQTGVLPTEEAVDGVPVHRIPWRGSTRYPLAPSVLSHLGSAHVLHVHAIDFFFDFLALTRPLHRRPMIASTHGGFFHSAAFARSKRLWFDSVTRASLLAYARVVACSHSDADLFRHRAGRRLRVIENGINQDKFIDASARTPTRTIVAFGRFARHKRIVSLLALLGALRSKDPGWRLLIAGRDADQSAGELRDAARSAGVADAVRFELSPSDVELRALLADASYFACLSAHEGFGIAAVEAMSAGLLPILSGITPFRRLVTQTGLGLIVDADDPGGAAETILAAHSEDPARRESERAALIQAAKRYDWRHVAALYTDLYRDVAGVPA